MGRLTWVKSSADHPWHDDEKHREDFQISSQHWSTFGMGEVLGREWPLDYHLQLVRKGVGSKAGALQREQDPSLLLFSWMIFMRQDPRVFCMPMATFPSRLTAACCHCSELSVQAMAEGSMEISFRGIISPLTEVKPPWGLETAVIQQQETRNEADEGVLVKVQWWVLVIIPPWTTKAQFLKKQIQFSLSWLG